MEVATMGVSYKYPEPLKDWHFWHPENEYEAEGDYKRYELPDLLDGFVGEGGSHWAAVGNPSKAYEYVLNSPSLEEPVTIRKWLRYGDVCVLEGVTGGREFPVHVIIAGKGKTKTLYCIE
jgi:hypothetical protein